MCKTHFIGRVCRDEKEILVSTSGEEYVVLGVVYNNRGKDADGSLIDDPVFLDAYLFNRRGGRNLADLARDLQKNEAVYLEGRIVHHKHIDRAAGGNNKLVLLVDSVEHLGRKADRKPPEPRYAPMTDARD